jgi:hypothetical protein
MCLGSSHPVRSRASALRWSLGVILTVVLGAVFGISSPAHAELEQTFFSGTVAPGASVNGSWHNIWAGTGYKIGLSPVGASTSAACQFEVTNQWYEGLNTGERRFHWTIKNIGSLACGANQLLSWVWTTPIKSTGGMEPNEIKTFFVPITHHGTVFDVPLLDLIPSGATSANTCRFKVRRMWFQRVAQGDVAQPVYLYYQVQNIGNIACSAEVEMGTVPVESRLSLRTVGAGSSISKRLLNVNPLSATHLIGIEPQELGCAMEMTRHYYRQVVDTDGTLDRELAWTMKNLGTTQCSAIPLVSRI